MSNDLTPGPFSLANPRSLFDATAFEAEQDKLGKVWNCVGRVADLTEDNAWIRTRLGGRSIFIQRFGAELRGFVNRCAHRSFPLRTEERGKGPIVCGFHHWRYDADGFARGIPNCMDMFGVSPRELNAKLQKVEIAVCGGLVFARFPSDRPQPDLREYLGSSFDIVEALTAPSQYQKTFKTDVKANWRLLAHISLDDYHIVAVHPTTFGQSGYLAPGEVSYFRDGLHSAYFSGKSPGNIADMATACRLRSYVPERYRTLHLFPNLILSHTHILSFAGVSVWYVIVLFYIPTAAGRTELHVFFQPSPFSSRGTGVRRLAHDMFEGIRSRIVDYYTRNVIAEDNIACEKLQENACKQNGKIYLAAQEQRIAWFEDSYNKFLN
jgi:phenylpropionate dioxygenase-like ring-hydroxylating dioxygenase large terminal subunit